MIKVIFAAHRRTDMTREEFVEYWTTTHADLARAIPGVRRYVVNITIGRSADAQYDGVAEVAYDSIDDLKVAARSAQAAAVIADEPNLFDLDNCVRLVASERLVVG
ncbi:EthD family reductase [Jatrophihabitans sp.]|uniref:EthD family reductase n=1 Tax=Jatrophihabitans sp. TaxID=1932789 RepID=UPI0030C6FD60|nr:hypothetical protein [Jatrophihabitans sp.]